jgi:RimJ/RimL family protein N-acetyltransferase
MMYWTTERMRLRRFGPADLDNLVELDSDPEVMRYLSGGAATPRDVIEREILPAFMRFDAAELPFGVWAATGNESQGFLGWFSLRLTEGSHGSAALGYRLHRTAWGRGYATEGVRALIERAFRETAIERIVATTYEENLASRRVMEKAGMTFIRAFRLTAADLTEVATYAADPADIWEGEDVEYAVTRAQWAQAFGSAA